MGVGTLLPDEQKFATELAKKAVGGLLWLAWQGQGHFGQPPLVDSVWLLLAGPFTAVPSRWRRRPH